MLWTPTSESQARPCEIYQGPKYEGDHQFRRKREKRVQRDETSHGQIQRSGPIWASISDYIDTAAEFIADIATAAFPPSKVIYAVISYMLKAAAEGV
jgi:fungal STAND N-terminal Goodbye domain